MELVENQLCLTRKLQGGEGPTVNNATEGKLDG